MSDTSVKALSTLFHMVSSKTNGKGSAGNFSEVFDLAAQNGGSTDSPPGNIIPEAGKTRPEYNDKRPESMRDTSKTEKVLKSDETVNKEDEAMAKANELVEAVAKELGVSPEEVEKAMEALGITALDLFKPSVMTELVLTLSGSDMTALLTNEGLYESLQGLLAFSKNGLESLQQELGLSAEELNLLLESMKQETPELAAPETDAPDMQENLQKPPAADGGKDVVNNPQEAITAPLQNDKAGAAENGETKTTEAVHMETDRPGQHDETAPKTDSGEKKDSPFQRDNVFTNIAPQTVSGDTAIPAAANFNETIAGQRISPNDIMNQIMDSMRVSIRSDITQMQIQLHPASLGTININISSKDGVISAQFLAQNEAVKQVIESQIVQLKNNFEEQGLKVEAIEVTVESHKFERNLSGQNEQQQNNTPGKKKNSHRRINLDAISAEETEALDESEQIAVELMNMNGSSVDFTA